MQAGWGVLSNAYIKGFLPGAPYIYRGPLKKFCVPGLNCHSCPGALGACPIGAMQAVFDGNKRRFAFYVVGWLAMIGLLVGRFVCGWLCLFGLIQELLYKIPGPKLKVPQKLDRALRYLKYVVLIVLVFALPFIFRTKLGIGEPFFCKYLCPAGTLEAGVPLVILDKSLRPALGLLFKWKFAVLIVCLLSCTVIYRPFCKYVCPLGAFYALFQKVSFMRMHVDAHKCINCGLCAKACKMDIDPVKDANNAECIRCGECVGTCPHKAISFGLVEGKTKK